MTHLETAVRLLWRRGLSDRAIASALGYRSQGYIHRIRRRLGLEANRLPSGQRMEQHVRAGGER